MKASDKKTGGGPVASRGGAGRNLAVTRGVGAGMRDGGMRKQGTDDGMKVCDGATGADGFTSKDRVFD